MNDRVTSQASLWTGLALALSLVLLVAPRITPYSFLFRDGSFYAQTVRGLERNGSLRQEEVQPRSWYDGSLPWYRNVDDAWSNVSVGVDGEWYPKHSYLAPLLALPFHWAFGPHGLLIFNLAVLWLGLFLGYRLAASVSGEVPAILALGLVLLSPLVGWVAYAFSHDVLCGALVALSAWAMATRRPLGAGIAAGLALVAKPTNAMVLFPLLWAWSQGIGVRGVVRAVVGASLPLGAYGIANWWMYGAPWVTSYHRILTVRNGTPEIVSYGQAFDFPFLQGIRRFFQQSAEGEVWPMARPAVLAWLGVPLLARRRGRLAIGLGVALVAFTWTFARYRYGGARFFLPMMVLAPIPGAALISMAGSALGRLGDGCKRVIVRHRVWSIAVGLAVLISGLGITRWIRLRGQPPEGATLASSVETLKVWAGEVPCDYFNLAHHRWECSGLDHNASLFTGAAIGTECDSWWDGQAVWLPPGPRNHPRRIDWRPASGGSTLRVHWGRAGRGPPLTIRLRVAGREVWSREVPEGIGPQEEDLPLSLPPEADVTVEVGPEGSPGAVCMDLIPLP